MPNWSSGKDTNCLVVAVAIVGFTGEMLMLVRTGTGVTVSRTEFEIAPLAAVIVVVPTA